MELQTIQQYFTIENMQQLLQSYRNFGPMAGILLPMLEAFLPFLPLFAFIMANAAAYGLWGGFFYSWLGSCIGSLLLFLLIRSFGRHRFFGFVNRHPKVRKSMSWIERKGFGPIFLLFCLPFSPSALINVVAGLSRISKKQFVLALLLGKVVMILGMSYIGYDIFSFVKKPIKTLIVAGIVFVLWYIGKKIEIRLELGKE
ncbi:TVP38/TMEM64 family protein [Ectobacillus sp. JY-23]|uniref:TVP38/TMEM64 family protein n=1 Tax=Ectobacillus sp. JY-23 TaxID=2933872 RepID=UPI001FF39D48|nr:TVP38/TMEM64 family protein [Ectobacillus sp. JY-23]UOY92082.1 TVP38/TMEM64 family protein [Ectobacillus sp. JY-23]